MLSSESKATQADGPSVSVIIPAYNSARFLPLALESVFNQTFRNFEVIVVDDGSTDDTEARLAPYRERIRYIRQQNRGPASARNAGIKAAHAPLIAFLYADDLWLPEKLELQIAYLKEHGEVGVVFTDCAVFGERMKTLPSLKNDYGDIPSGMIFQELLTRHFIATSAILIRRECLEEAGCYDESLIGAEDYNLYLRLARRFQFGFLDLPLVRKRVHEENLSDRIEQMCHDEIMNLNKIAAQFPDAPIPRRKITARIYYRFGKEYFGKRQFAAARSCFQNALQHSPFFRQAWVFFAVSALPAGVRDPLLALHKARKAAR